MMYQEQSIDTIIQLCVCTLEEIVEELIQSVAFVLQKGE